MPRARSPHCPPVLRSSPLRTPPVHHAHAHVARCHRAGSRSHLHKRERGRDYEGFVQAAARDRGVRRRHLAARSSPSRPRPRRSPLVEGGSRKAPRHDLRGWLVDGRSLHDCAASLPKSRCRQDHITVGISGTGGGFERFCRGETDLSDGVAPDAPIARRHVCKTNNIGSWRAFTVANDALTVVVSRENTWATCLDGRRAQEDLGAGLEGEQPARRARELPQRAASPLRGRNRLRDVRVLHRGDQRSRSRESPPTTRPPRTTTCSSKVLRAPRAGSATSASRTTRRTRAGSRPCRSQNPKTGQCVTPSVATAQNNTLQAALAAALHLREGLVVQAARGAGVPRLHLRQREGDRDAGASSCRSRPPSSSGRGSTSISRSRRRTGPDLGLIRLRDGAATRPPRLVPVER